MKPFLVTSVEAARLPRWIPLLLSAVYVVAGLFGRDPWRSEDAAGFGIALTMATGSAIDWLLPNVEGELIPDVGPLPFWLGAIAIRLVAPLNGLLAPLLGPDAIGADTAFRAVAAAGLATTLALLWYAAYQFGRHVLAVGGRSAIAADEHLAVGRERRRDPVDRFGYRRGQRPGPSLADHRPQPKEPR